MYWQIYHNFPSQYFSNHLQLYYLHCTVISNSLRTALLMAGFSARDHVDRLTYVWDSNKWYWCCTVSLIWALIEGFIVHQTGQAPSNFSFFCTLRWNRRDGRAALNDLFICAVWWKSKPQRQCWRPSLFKLSVDLDTAHSVRVRMWGNDKFICINYMHANFRRTVLLVKCFKKQTKTTIFCTSGHLCLNK